MKKYFITVNGNTYEVEIEAADGDTAKAASASKPAAVPTASAPTPAPVAAPPPPVAPKATVGGNAIKSPMPGTITAVKVAVGDSVKKGDVVCILEAMKMENDIVAPNDGTVSGVHVSKGTSVDTGAPLISL